LRVVRNLQNMRDDTGFFGVLVWRWDGVTPVRTGCAKPVISIFRNRALGSIFCSMTRVEKVEVQGGVHIVDPPRYLPWFGPVPFFGFTF
jgi:hypothetical protein